MTDHTGRPATGRAPADPARLQLEFRHRDRLMDPTAAGAQVWQVDITADGEPAGSLQATRGLWWKAVDLRERLTDEGSFTAEVARRILRPDGAFTDDFDDLIQRAGYLLVLDRCEMKPPWDDPLTVAGVVTSVIDRLTDTFFAVVLPRAGAPGSVGAHLLEPAGRMLAAVEFTDELLILDTSRAPLAGAAIRVRDRLIDRSRHGGVDRAGLDERDWIENREYQALTPRTAALLRLAMRQLSREAWQEVAALGDAALPRDAGGVFGSLPPVTLRQDRAWRRRMARVFDDLAAGLCDARSGVVALCTAEELAFHLGISRARNIHRNRPRQLAEAVEGLPAAARDYDWKAAADLLFRTYSALMLYDVAPDGTEDADSATGPGPGPGLADPSLQHWFDPLDDDRARDPDRGFRHP